MNDPIGKLYGIGVGPGDPDLLTLKAVAVLKRVSVVFTAASSKNDYSLALEIARQVAEREQLEADGFIGPPAPVAAFQPKPSLYEQYPGNDLRRKAGALLAIEVDATPAAAPSHRWLPTASCPQRSSVRSTSPRAGSSRRFAAASRGLWASTGLASAGSCDQQPLVSDWVGRAGVRAFVSLLLSCSRLLGKEGTLSGAVPASVWSR